MRLNVEFDSEWWRVTAWWHRTQCRVMGHPGWKPRLPMPVFYAAFLGAASDDRLRCVRCHAPNPDEPQPPGRPMTYSFPSWTA